MRFRHNEAIWEEFSAFSAAGIVAERIHTDVDVSTAVQYYLDLNSGRSLSSVTVPQRPVYRGGSSNQNSSPSTAESAFGSARIENHPLADLCRAATTGLGIQVTILDVAKLSTDLQVRRATGNEVFEIGGIQEHPDCGEIIFADDSGRAHTRMWSAYQSSHSSIENETSDVLIIFELQNSVNQTDLIELADQVSYDIADIWSTKSTTTIISKDRPAVYASASASQEFHGC